MTNRQILSFALAVGVGAAFATPFAVQAEGPSHFAPNEAGVVYHPSEAGSVKSTAQVSAELATARTTPDGASMLRWGSVGTPKVGASKTRAEVLAELHSAQRQPNWDAASRLGAPQPVSKADTGKARAQALP
jgi:hypothetical protein